MNARISTAIPSMLAATPEKESSVYDLGGISAELRELGRHMAALDEICQHLHERLHPVLLDDPNRAAKPQEPVQSRNSGMAAELQAHNGFLCSKIDHLRLIYSLIDI